MSSADDLFSLCPQLTAKVTIEEKMVPHTLFRLTYRTLTRQCHKRDSLLATTHTHTTAVSVNPCASGTEWVRECEWNRAHKGNMNGHIDTNTFLQSLIKSSTLCAIMTHSIIPQECVCAVTQWSELARYTSIVRQ